MRIGTWIVFALAVWLVMWWPVLVGGQVLYHGDIANQGLPLRWHVAQHLRNGLVPLWSDALFAGFPLSGGQAGLWWPGTWVMAAIPANPARVFSVLLAGMYLVAWAGMFLLARQLGLGAPAAALAATAWAYCSPLPARHVHPNLAEIQALLPWFVLGVDMAVCGKTVRRASGGVALAAVVLALQVFAYQPQLVMFSFATGAAYGLFRPGDARTWRRGALIAAIGALGAALSMPQLLPAAELVRWNAAAEPRGPEYMLRYAPRARQVIGMLLPGFWGNSGLWLGGGNYHETSLATGLVVLGLVFSALRLPACVFPKRLLLAIALAALAVSLPTISQVHLLLAHVPGFGAMRALARCWFVGSWALALVAGWAAQELARGQCGAPQTPRTLYRAGWLLAAAVIPLIIVASLAGAPAVGKVLEQRLGARVGPVEFLRHLPTHWRSEYGLTGAGTWGVLAAVAGLLGAAALLKRGRPRLAMGVLLAAVFIEGTHVLSLSVTTAPASSIYAAPPAARYIQTAGAGLLARAPGDPRPQLLAQLGLVENDPRIHAICSQLLLENRPLLWSLCLADGCEAKVIQPHDLLQLLREAGITPDQAGAQGAEARRKAVVYGILGVHYVVTPWWVELRGGEWKLAWAQWPTKVWQNSLAQPEARLIGIAERVSNGTEARRLSAAGTPALVLSAPAELPGTTAAHVPTRAKGSVVRYRRAPGLWKAVVNSDTAALLVITNRAYPGWRIYLDGRAVDQARAYGSLQCVAVGRGTHQIWAVYWPPVYVLGGFVGGAALVLTVALAIIAVAAPRTSEA